ncbi:unnamed protein product [Timema podura]|uniref:Uncharacterized protein n=2 Tax=Timema TaxID=61471 RepID=A0A7R9KA53_TIMGE|nr:unnamed protein product [Timema genevievae]CAG2069252.1 unnamed protein product [Timema podura]
MWSQQFWVMSTIRSRLLPGAMVDCSVRGCRVW